MELWAVQPRQTKRRVQLINIPAAPWRLGELSSVVGELQCHDAALPTPHTASQFGLSSLQNHYQHTRAKRSVSAPQYKASLALSAPLSSAGLNSHSHITSYEMSRTLLTVHKTSSQVTTLNYSNPPFSHQLRWENSIGNPTYVMPGVQHRDPLLGCRNQWYSSHSSNSLQNTRSSGTWHAAEYSSVCPAWEWSTGTGIQAQ